VVLEAVAGGELGAGLRDLRVRPPDRVRTFTGRVEELAWLRQAAGDPVVVTQALAGRASGRSL
jgi:hypothetical protein